MVPITLFWAGLCGLLVLFLTIAVIQRRMGAKVLLGTGGDPVLERRIRAHGNAVEFIPLCLVLLLLLELSGHPAWLLHVLGGGFLVGRIAHAQGLMGNAGESPGRMVGAILTMVYLLAASVLCVIAGIRLL